MPAADKVRIETELAAIMPASHTRYSLPLAPVVDEPLRYEEVASLAAPSERYKSMATFNLALDGLTAAELDEVTKALNAELGGNLLERVVIAPVFA